MEESKYVSLILMKLIPFAIVWTLTVVALVFMLVKAAKKEFEMFWLYFSVVFLILAGILGATYMGNMILDISNHSYVEYTGPFEFTGKYSLVLNDGSGIVLDCDHIVMNCEKRTDYGHMVYSERSHVLVFFDELDPPV